MPECDGPDWLDPGERRAWLALVGVVMRLSTVMDTRMQADAGITFFEYSTMAMLSEQPDRTLPMSTVAALTTSTLTRLSHVTRRLEDRGWVQRCPSPADGRITLATLTDAGMAMVEHAAGPHVTAVREVVVDHLTARQIAVLGDVGERLMPGLWPEGVPRPAGVPGDACPPGPPGRAVRRGRQNE